MLKENETATDAYMRLRHTCKTIKDHYDLAYQLMIEKNKLTFF